MSAFTMTEQVEALIDWARQEASRTGLRQRVEAVRMPNGPGWYYQTRVTARWPHWLAADLSDARLLTRRGGQ